MNAEQQTIIEQQNALADGANQSFYQSWDPAKRRIVSKILRDLALAIAPEVLDGALEPEDINRMLRYALESSEAATANQNEFDAAAA